MNHEQSSRCLEPETYSEIHKMTLAIQIFVIRILLGRESDILRRTVHSDVLDSDC
jgi:hypothetical protein